MRAVIERGRARREAERQREEAAHARLVASFVGECRECLDAGACEHCDRGRAVLLERRKEEGQRQRDAWRSLMLAANIPAKRWQQTLDTHPWQRSPALLALRSWLDTWDGQRGLMLLGAQYGVGKTGLMVGAMQQIAWRYVGTSHRMLFVPCVSMMDALRSGYGDGDYSEQLTAIMRVRLLCLDDLARENITQWARDRLFDIVNTRTEAGLPTFLTSNHGLDALEQSERLGAAVADRLTEHCDVIRVTGPNLRPKATVIA